MSRKIVFFDGHCNLCNGFIDFLVTRDKKGQFHIASLQGKTAEKLLTERDRLALESVVLLDEGTGHIAKKSKAVLRILASLGLPYSLMAVFMIVPKFISDIFYDLIAKNRYRLFGHKETCRIPTEEERRYFLE